MFKGGGAFKEQGNRAMFNCWTTIDRTQPGSIKQFTNFLLYSEYISIYSGNKKRVTDLGAMV